MAIASIRDSLVGGVVVVTVDIVVGRFDIIDLSRTTIVSIRDSNSIEVEAYSNISDTNNRVIIFPVIVEKLLI